VSGSPEELPDIREEACRINRTVQHRGRVDAVVAQGGKKSERLPVALRRFGPQPFSLAAATVRADHIGLDPGFVDENQTLWIDFRLMSFPDISPSPDVDSVLFGGQNAFF